MTRTTLMIIASLVGMALISIVYTVTENTRTRRFGGDTHVTLPCGQKLTLISWKDDDLWYATRPMREAEEPETTTYQEGSALGLMEGTVTVTECRS